ncbi:zinc-binding dehydrogenase [Nonomuraea diastatica]|uniref:Zn-dependent oxidoreductase n=1 Tax=Nonomuraea diastatica TaxID=1848329 RepID=A0A4R4WZD6_9ACTN|nr:zinc-binding dehydrogenase [Nonomuraea diastatica]TDD23249.1 Zn-dependent oxidoreductase [Nonomuraea diastatica]
MRAYLLTGFGGPEKLEYREDVADPVPATGEVRVRVTAAGVNNTDIWTREGAYGDPDSGHPSAWRGTMTFPRIQGADIVGHIDQVGEDVPVERIGERVIVDPVLYSGNEKDLASSGLMGSERDGGFAEFATVPAANALPVDSTLDDAELASFPTAYQTAYRMVERVGLGESESVLVTGASGGVGSALVQLAKARGSHVVAVVGPGKEQQALQAGADATLGRGAVPERESVDVVADVVGGPSFSALLDALRPLGRYVTAGAIAGPVVNMDLRGVYLKELTLVGSTVSTHEQFAALVREIEQGGLRPFVAGTYPLRELPRAQQDFVSKKFFGKLVITP